MNNKVTFVEIMSPVGSYESLAAAFQGGANSVYFGIEQLNMRSRSSNNFTIKDLQNIATLCKEKGVKTYITLNTIIYDDELVLMKQIVDAAKNHEIDAIIASDMAVFEYAHQKGVEIHASTQCNISNTHAVKFFARYADVMVTARELSLKQVANITQNIEEENITGPSGDKVKIEVFAHGALCMAVSGKCYLSLDNMNYSANRGACLQLCRRKYLVKDKDEGYELEVDNEYIMSPKDLCTIGFLDKIIKAGVKVLKIEGRGRPPEYVKTVTATYKEAIEAINCGRYTQENINRWETRLRSVFNRDFWDGYYLGRKLGEWTKRYGSQASKRKTYVGKVTNYFSKIGVAELKIETHDINVGDEYYIIGSTTGVLEGEVNELRSGDGVDIQTAGKGNICSIPVKEVVRRGDKLYRVQVVEENF